MERLFLGHETAFWIWRKVGPLGPAALTPTRIHSLKGGSPSRSKIDAFRGNHPDLAGDTLDVMVQYGDQRNIPGTKVHVKSGGLPERSFYRLDDDVYVASPELCLMQLASKLPKAHAVKAGMEMCGSYAVDLFYDDPGFCKRPPLTSARRLHAYSDRLYRPGSRARATGFLRWLVDGSASPRETALCMLLCMPPRLGGYGIASPQMNKRIELSIADQLMSGSRYYKCDLYWPDRRIAVEYDSARYHAPEERQERDAVRRNMLQYKGIRVITATRRQVGDPAEFDKLARQIAHAVGKRVRTPEKDHVDARFRLRETLFKWDAVAEQARCFITPGE